jgi:hypothetical protein
MTRMDHPEMDKPLAEDTHGGQGSGVQRKREIERQTEPRILVLDYCDDWIDWYEEHKRKSRIQMQVFQTSAIMLSGLTPVLVILQTLAEDYQSWRIFLTILIALFPASVAVITGLDSVFHWKDNYLRFAQACETLKNEKKKYLSRTTQRYSQNHSDHQALTNFVLRITQVVIKETEDWRSLFEQSADLEDIIANLKSPKSE